jgi:hypothetical protein
MKTSKKTVKTASSAKKNAGHTKTSARAIALAAAGLLLATSLVYVACDSSDDNAVKEQAPGTDSGMLSDGAPIPVTDSGGNPPFPDATFPDGAPADCFMNPTTHFEIINACTNAVKITKNPVLPLLLSDGGLPPLM